MQFLKIDFFFGKQASLIEVNISFYFEKIFFFKWPIFFRPSSNFIFRSQITLVNEHLMLLFSSFSVSVEESDVSCGPQKKNI